MVVGRLYPAKANIKMKKALLMAAAASAVSKAAMTMWPKVLVNTMKIQTKRNAQAPRP
jgi:NAD(P)H-hydrate repair Nnr-like enzyme with NAD(P)H-hydrate epimerase domain